MIRMHRARHSLSGKLLLIFIIMAVIIATLVSLSLRLAFRDHFDSTIRPHLLQYMEYVQRDIGFPARPERARILADKLGLEIHIMNGSNIWSSTQKPVQPAFIRIEKKFIQNGMHYAWVEFEDKNYLMASQSDSRILFSIKHVQTQGDAWRKLHPILLILLVLFFLYHLIRRLFAPIKTIQYGLKRFGQGDMDHRIRIHRRDELSQLADSFNEMAADIQKMLDAKRQLLLAISHELRSPLTRAKVAIELLSNDKQRIQLNQDMDEMETLIEEILETERLSTPHSVLNKSPTDLNALLTQLTTNHVATADIQLQLPETNSVMEVDTARIKLLLKNLIDNAIRHSHQDVVRINVKLTVEPDEVTIQVVDQGQGIEEKHIPHLTEPFYRVDPARQRETGGFGLGLYLCRAIVEAHAGRLIINSTPGQGTTVTIHLPR